MPSRARVTKVGGEARGTAVAAGRERSREPRNGRGPHVERDLQGGQLVEIQRSRLIAAAVCAIEELGYAQVTVGQITRRASVSRRTFYELFSDREECLSAVLEDALAALAAELARADLEGLPWPKRVRGGLATVLAFFDREPALARVCVVQALHGGPRVLERREHILAELAVVLDEGRAVGARGAECAPLTAEGLVGAAFGIVYARLFKRESPPLTDLVGELMAMIVLPYLGPAAARRELAHPAPAVRSERVSEQPAIASVGESPFDDLGIRLTYRTARVLEGVDINPRASNREVGGYAGVADPGQISKLLARLERAALVRNTGGGHAKGEPNAWILTARGEQVARSIRVPERHASEAA
jgi:AcrR family transcriptional regulator